MVEQNTIVIVKDYLSSLRRFGINAVKGVLFGSFSTGKMHEWSDIDLVVIAPEFDLDHSIGLVKKLWIAARYTDSRIEPVACGATEWEENSDRPIIDIARREGIEISLV